jgi:hypothetical protein
LSLFDLNAPGPSKKEDSNEWEERWAGDYISQTDIAKYRNSDAPSDIVKNWLRSSSTIEFLGLWEQLNNPGFKLVEFNQFKNEAGAIHLTDSG